MTDQSLDIYVAFHGGRCLARYHLSEAGALTLSETHPLPGHGLPLAHSWDGQRLYASVFSVEDGGETDRIEAFSRDPATGALTPLGGADTVGRLTHISVDRSNAWVLGASYFAHCIVSHRIGPDGTLGAPAHRLETGLNAHHILMDPSNRFAFVPNLGSDQVLQVLFEAETGRFAENAVPALTQPTGAGCRHMAHHPTLPVMYLINERDGSVVRFDFKAETGRLSERQRDTCLRTPVADPWAAQLLVSPDGRQLFASERRTHVLTRWALDPETGDMGDRRTIDVGQNPRGFDITPDSRCLILGALEDDCLEVYDITQPGGHPILISRKDCASEPAWVHILPRSG